MNLSLDSKTPDYNLYKITDDTIPKNTYIITSDKTKKVLYNPYVAGKKLQDAMEEVSTVFIKAISAKGLKDIQLSSVVEYILLAGGLYYNLNYGFKKVYDRALPQCFLGIKRQRIEGTEGKFAAVTTYENFESLQNNATVIIGDTIASGATIVRAIQNLENALEEKDYSLKNLIIISLACSTKGARKLKKIEAKIKGNLYLFVAEQLFQVMPNGTDLRFLKEDTIMPDETREYTLKTYGEFLGREMKCAVFDWGTRCKNPKKYYEEFLEFAEEVLKNQKIDKQGQEIIENMKKETEDILKREF